MADDPNGKQTRRNFIGAGGIGGAVFLMLDGTRNAIVRQWEEFLQLFRATPDPPKRGQLIDPPLVRNPVDPPSGSSAGIDLSPNVPMPGTQAFDQLTTSVHESIDEGSQNLYYQNLQAVSEQRRQDLQRWGKETICWYLDHQEKLADGLKVSEVAEIVIDELEPESAEKIAESVVNSTFELQEAYEASNYSALFLTSVKVSVCPWVA